MLCKKELCVGCGACAASCETGAVRMERNEMGFLYPHLDKALCVGCGACERACPGLSMPERERADGKIVASWSMDLSLREKSSSGGIFSLLAEKAISEHGRVFGAAFTDAFAVKHIYVRDRDGLSKLQGSKYAQSDVGATYAECREALSHKERVLFSGTPCQIAGLYKYLGGDDPNLLTVDLLCHGAASPGLWRYYLDLLEKKYGSKVQKVTFKSKKTGWHCASLEVTFRNGKKYRRTKDTDPFMRAFLKNYTLRASCYDCRFAGSERQGDITLGDFWGYRAGASPYKDDDRGISFVMLNTEKGERFFGAVRGRTVSVPQRLEDALPGNLCLKKGVPKPPDHMDFWRTLGNEGFDAARKKYMRPDKRFILNRLLWTPLGIAIRRLLKKA